MGYMGEYSCAKCHLSTTNSNGSARKILSVDVFMCGGQRKRGERGEREEGGERERESGREGEENRDTDIKQIWQNISIFYGRLPMT